MDASHTFQYFIHGLSNISDLILFIILCQVGFSTSLLIRINLSLDQICHCCEELLLAAIVCLHIVVWGIVKSQSGFFPAHFP